MVGCALSELGDEVKVDANLAKLVILVYKTRWVDNLEHKERDKLVQHDRGSVIRVYSHEKHEIFIDIYVAFVMITS